MLERSHLAILREVERQGTLTGAAQALCLTQPALSHAIKKLEQQIGTAVWIKEGRELVFTQAGQYLLAMANRLLPQFEHAEDLMQQYANGQRGSLRIGMECHPCYQWMLKIVEPYLQQWPDVDIDVKQQFQFGGIGALFSYDIDLLISPDPLFKKGLEFTPVLDYEQVLVVGNNHPLARKKQIKAEDLNAECLYTYPVDIERLDIFSQFLLPAGCAVKQHKTVETTDIMLQMVACGRGVTALPDWLVAEYSKRMPIRAIRLGPRGIQKQIYIGIRSAERNTDYLQSFVEIARQSSL